MALLVCEKCTTLYSVGADKCPQCGSKQRHEDGERPTPKAKAKK